jgi:hypothetical protein
MPELCGYPFHRRLAGSQFAHLRGNLITNRCPLTFPTTFRLVENLFLMLVAPNSSDRCLSIIVPAETKVKDYRLVGVTFEIIPEQHFMNVAKATQYPSIRHLILTCIFWSGVAGARSYPDQKAAFLSENIGSRKFYIPAGSRVS